MAVSAARDIRFAQVSILSIFSIIITDNRLFHEYHARLINRNNYDLFSGIQFKYVFLIKCVYELCNVTTRVTDRN